MSSPADGDLPSLPQIVLRMLHACHNDADYRELGQLIASDTALSSRVMALANSSYFNRGQPVNSLERALLRLGIENLRTLVITAALRQFLQDLGADHWQQLRDFWRHSLATALMARTLAVLTRYPAPDEAYLAGMLHNIGELMALKMAAAGTENDVAISPHAEAGAQLAERWELGPLVADAIRYQQTPPEEIWDTPHLVKLINLSTRLAMSDNRGMEAARTLFGLTAALTREICSRIDQEVASLAESLSIPLEGDSNALEVRQALLTELLNHGLVNEATTALRRSTDDQQFSNALLTSVEYLCDAPAIVLAVEGEWLTAQAISSWPELSLRLPREPARSLIATCAAEGRILTTYDDGVEPAIVDQQLGHLLKRAHLIYLPLHHQGQCLGVVVAGIDQPLPKARLDLLALFAREAGQLRVKLGQERETDQSARSLERLEQELVVRRVAHEISNPLTIIRNYLSTLQDKLSDDESVSADLQVVREELERAADLLLQLRDTREEIPEGSELDINTEVRNLADLLQDSLFAAHDVHCQLSLSEAPVTAHATRGPLRQVLVNLVRNAVEAMSEGGELEIRTSPSIWQGHRNWIEISISDSGTGLPESVRQNMFRPVQTTKGEGHSGLGLSIVKQLIDDMEGIISCRTGSDGTSFQILLPAVPGDKQDKKET